jgi:hypothetical protein
MEVAADITQHQNVLEKKAERIWKQTNALQCNRQHELIQLLFPLLLLLLLPLLLLLVVDPPQPKACTRLSQAPNARLGQVPASASAKNCCYYCCYYNFSNYSSSNARASTITITTTLILRVGVRAHATYLSHLAFFALSLVFSIAATTAREYA